MECTLLMLYEDLDHPENIEKEEVVRMRMNPTWKEVVVYRHWRCVHVYNLVSHGRRMYRQLVFSSNHSLSLQVSGVANPKSTSESKRAQA